MKNSVIALLIGLLLFPFASFADTQGDYQSALLQLIALLTQQVQALEAQLASEEGSIDTAPIGTQAIGGSVGCSTVLSANPMTLNLAKGNLVGLSVSGCGTAPALGSITETIGTSTSSTIPLTSIVNSGNGWSEYATTTIPTSDFRISTSTGAVLGTHTVNFSYANSSVTVGVIDNEYSANIVY